MLFRSYSKPLKGQTIKVHPDLQTTVMAVLEFESGAVVNVNLSWDAWDSVVPRMELYGSKATLLMEDEDPNAGPNVFGGDTLIKTMDTYRWKSMPRDDEETAIPWDTAEVKHPYDSVSYVHNHRGIGLVDMVNAIKSGGRNRAGGDMALHMLEVAEAMITSAKEHRYITLESSFIKPDAMPPKS